MSTKGKTTDYPERVEIGLIFRPDRPLYEPRFVFKYRIQDRDYETFFGIVNGFFTDEVDEDQLSEIKLKYPDYKKDEFFNINGETLREIFGRDYTAMGVNQVEDTEGNLTDMYEVNWAT